MFYDKTIQFLVESEGYLDDSGIWHDGEEMVIKSILADVQPYSRERAYKDYGFMEEVTYRIFSDLDNFIKIGSNVIYRGNKFKIRKIIEWDDFVEWMIHVT